MCLDRTDCAAQHLHQPERPTASPLGSLLASLVGARLCRALGAYVTVALVLVALAVVTVNVFVTVQVLRNRENGLGEKAMQLAFVWLLPIVGALIAFHILREAHDIRRAGDTPFVESGVGDTPSSSNAVEGFSGGEGGDGH